MLEAFAGLGVTVVAAEIIVLVAYAWHRIIQSAVAGVFGEETGPGFAQSSAPDRVTLTILTTLILFVSWALALMFGHDVVAPLLP